MDTIQPLRLLPTLPMLYENLKQAGLACEMAVLEETQHYREVRLYHPRQKLQKDILYLLRPTEAEFPFDDYAYVSSAPHPGRANHLVCPGYPDEEILDQLLEVFSQFRQWEEAIDLLLYRGASLQELCELGARLLENPVCIHDDWFVMTAMTADFADIMEPEFLMSSAKGFVPRAVVEDFRYDSDYLETYAHHDARIWWAQDGQYHSLYVNLWDGPVYKGRLLVAPKNREFRQQDFLLAEVLTQRAVMLLRRRQLGEETVYPDMDSIVFGLLLSRQQDPADLTRLLHVLKWDRQDSFLCLRLKPQQLGQSTVAEHLLHTELFRCFPGSYILLGKQEQCVVLNLTKAELPVGLVRHKLAPICRDYCLYVGISSPVSGVRELPAAYHQAGVALEQAFRLSSDRWAMHFSDCALQHLVDSLPSPLSPAHLVSPELTSLMAYDREKGTPYFETLREFLLQERDIPRTAEALIIHRTTLLYRLKKLQTLIAIDLNDPWQRLQLMLSLWILEHTGQK
ncbi:MAG: helix-turn-helix domain-containing protein [Oscillospiraceae bacterium]|nr:helix-turn-helix domain-containing protein [Oscillospiraceae bacterium]